MVTSKPNRIGALLRAEREGQRLSLGALAAQSGIHKATLSRWEAGRRQPSVPELEAVLGALSVSPAGRAEALAHIDAPRAVRALRQNLASSPETHGAVGRPPAGGDLLRAMRLRRKMGQAELARAIGVDRSTLVRWERSETWPSATPLHRLCYLLGAREGEVVALTTHRFPSLPDSDTLDGLAQHVEILDQVPLGEMDALYDLTYLAIEAALWPHALRQEMGKELLGMTYSYHATYLYARGRFQEAGEVAQRCLETPHLHQHLPQMTQCIVYKARSVAESQGSYALKRSLVVLQEGLRYSLNPDQQAWLWMQMAYNLKCQGRREEALEAMARSNRLPHHNGLTCGETYEGRLCTVGLLCDAGYPARAWELLPAEIHSDPYHRVRTSLLASEVLLALGKPSEAHDWLLCAQQDIDRFDLANFRSEAFALADKF